MIKVLTKLLAIAFLAVICLSLGSCTARKFIPKDKYIIVSDEIEISDKTTSISKSDLSGFISQKPHRSFLGIRIKLWIWYISEPKSTKKFWKWMHNTVGDEPVYYDEFIAGSNADQMRRYLSNVGYMNAKAVSEVKKGKQTARLKFIIEPSWPYTISEIKRIIPDSILAGFEQSIREGSLLKKGDVLNMYLIGNERDRITNYLKNNGYYYFTSDYIHFEVDSNFKSKQVSLQMKIDNVKSGETDHEGKEILVPHKRYFINQVTIQPLYNPFTNNTLPSDTVAIEVLRQENKQIHTQYFVFHGDPRINLKRFGQVIHLYDEDPFSFTKVKDTYRGLSNFRIYGNTNITFDTVLSTHRYPKDERNWLDCNILLQRNKVSGYTVELEGTNSSGDLGIKGNLVYQNKNIFRGSEQFRLRTYGGFEMQQIRDSTDGTGNSGVFNTTEIGIDASVFFPRFLSPLRLASFVRDYQPKTNLTIGVNSQNRYKYARFIYNLSFGYDWMASQTVRHTLTVININSVKVNPSIAFEEELNLETNQRIKDQYSNHLIFGLKYSYIFNNQNINKINDFFYFRANFESSGNLLSLFNNNLSYDTVSDRYDIFGITYAQFFRFDFDFRYYRVLTENNRLVFRAVIGSGIPYGNSGEMPFERSFYSGGANGMRGWQFRELGPGSYNGSDDVERIGDIQLEGNFEYRFPIYSFVKGALFTDVGNIWTISESTYLPGGKFNINNFYKELAMDAGIGLRFDFSFFIFRADFALPLRDPARTDGDRWMVHKLQINDTRFNFGIGYPF